MYGNYDNGNGCYRQDGYPDEPHPRGEIHVHPTVGDYNDATVPKPQSEYRYVVEGAGHERLSHHKTKDAAMDAAQSVARHMGGRVLVYAEGERIKEEMDFGGAGEPLALDTLTDDSADMSLGGYLGDLDNDNGGLL
jgi:hypothetical protein